MKLSFRITFNWYNFQLVLRLIGTTLISYYVQLVHISVGTIKIVIGTHFIWFIIHWHNFHLDLLQFSNYHTYPSPLILFTYNLICLEDASLHLLPTPSECSSGSATIRRLILFNSTTLRRTTLRRNF